MIKPNATVAPARSLREEDFFLERLGRSSRGMEFQPQGMSLKESTGESLVCVGQRGRLFAYLEVLLERVFETSVCVCVSV